MTNPFCATLSRGLRRSAVAALAVAGLSVGVSTLSATSAEAGWRHRHGGAIAAGIIGGLALGAVAAHAYAPRHGYYARPVYYRGGSCWWTRVRERVSYDTVVVRRVRVCD